MSDLKHTVVNLKSHFPLPLPIYTWPGRRRMPRPPDLLIWFAGSEVQRGHHNAHWRPFRRPADLIHSLLNKESMDIVKLWYLMSAADTPYPSTNPHHTCMQSLHLLYTPRCGLIPWLPFSSLVGYEREFTVHVAHITPGMLPRLKE